MVMTSLARGSPASQKKPSPARQCTSVFLLKGHELNLQMTRICSHVELARYTHACFTIELDGAPQPCTQAVEIEGISQSSNASLKKKKKKKTGLKKKKKTNTKENQGGVQKQGGKKDKMLELEDDKKPVRTQAFPHVSCLLPRRIN